MIFLTEGSRVHHASGLVHNVLLQNLTREVSKTTFRVEFAHALDFGVHLFLLLVLCLDLLGKELDHLEHFLAEVDVAFLVLLEGLSQKGDTPISFVETLEHFLGLGTHLVGDGQRVVTGTKTTHLGHITGTDEVT